MLELRHFRYFTVLAEDLHFGRAAQRLGIAQSALSAQIHALEVELGVKLLERTSRRVALTVAGVAFQVECVCVLRDANAAVAKARAAAGSLANQFTIGAIPAAAFGPLPVFLDLTTRRFPGIRIQITTGNTEAIIRQIERGIVNFGFVRPQESMGSLRHLKLTDDRYRLAIPVGHTLSKRERIGLDDLAGEKLIAFERSSLGVSERHLTKMLREARLEEHIVYRCDDTLTFTALVTAGLGIGFLPEWTSKLSREAFVLRDVEGVSLSISLNLVWNPDDPVVGRDVLIDLARGMAKRASSQGINQSR